MKKYEKKNVTGSNSEYLQIPNSGGSNQQSPLGRAKKKGRRSNIGGSAISSTELSREGISECGRCGIKSWGLDTSRLSRGAQTWVVLGEVLILKESIGPWLAEIRILMTISKFKRGAERKEGKH